MKIHPLSSTLTMVALTACATVHVPPNATSLDDLVQTYWKVPSYHFGKSDGIMTTVPHDRLNFLKDRIADLSAVCDRQRGNWEYLGASSRAESNPKSVGNTLSSALTPLLNAPTTQQNLTSTVQAAEQTTARDVFAATMSALQSVPDQETRSAIQHAEKLHWLGRYQCTLPTQSWGAEMRFIRPIRMSTEGVVYKRDVVIETLITKRD